MAAEPAELKVDPRFITGKLGDDFVLYDGLLDLAHKRGLRGIRVTIIQLPLDVNGNYAVCEATVEMENGAVFTDVGDASPLNTNKMVGLHILRMASTRAKARALRDAVNVGMVAVEELADEDQPARKAAPPQQRQAPRAPATPPVRRTVAQAREALHTIETAVDVAPAPAAQPTTRAEKEAKYTEIAEQALALGIRPVHPVSYFEGQPDEDLREAAVKLVAAIKAKQAAKPPDGFVPASPQQVQAIQRMARAAGRTVETDGLSRGDASTLLSELIGTMEQSRTASEAHR